MAELLSPTLNLGTDLSFCFRLLHLQDCLLSEEDKQLPLARHVVGIFQMLYFIEDTIVVVLMRSEKVIISDPEGDIVVGTLIVVIAAGYAVGGFKRTVETLDHLFERAELFGDFVLIRKPDDLGDIKAELLTELVEELLGRKRIGAVAIGDKAEVFRKLLQLTESHAHSKDAGTDTAVVGDLIAKDGTGHCIHDEPDVSFDSADFDIGFIGNKGGSGFVVIVVNERLDDEGGSPGIVGDLLMGDPDVVKVFESLGGLAQGEAEVDMESQAEPHDMCVMAAKAEGRSILRKGV